MTPRVPRIGRLALIVLALVTGVGCAVEEYNPKPIAAEADVLSNVTQLTAPTPIGGFERAGQGRFSPDEQWVIFRGVPRGDPPNAYGLFLARVHWAGTGGDRHVISLDRAVRITRPGTRCAGACFSPDGFSLAFSASPGPSTPDQPAPMRLFRADNWAQAVALTDAAHGIDLAQFPVTPESLATNECDWSPDGKTICVAATPVDGSIGIYAVRPDGSSLARICPPTGYARGAMFSPDGRRLVYRGDAMGRPASQIFAADLVRDRGGIVVGIARPKLLTNEGDVPSSGPCWLGNGHILYATLRHGIANAELYVMDAAGMRKTRLTMTAGPDLLPSVSADGHALLWTRAGSTEGAPQLYGADLDLPPGS